ncbi:hypothetical protein ACROYT_G019022 [Oculina patagonica]
MEIKIFPVLLCALFLLWTTQELQGYVSPWSTGKRNEIWRKERKTTGSPSAREKMCLAARMLDCDKEYRREEKITQE